MTDEPADVREYLREIQRLRALLESQQETREARTPLPPPSPLRRPSCPFCGYKPHGRGDFHNRLWRHIVTEHGEYCEPAESQ